jgi:hypothetical protein
MAAPAPRRAPLDEHRPAPAPQAAPPANTGAYRRALKLARARRRARIEHQAELKRARIRFLALLLGLVFLALFIGLSIWEKIESLFGL